MERDRLGFWAIIAAPLALFTSLLRVVVLLGFVPAGTPHREDILSRFLSQHGEAAFEDPSQVFGLIGRVEYHLESVQGAETPHEALEQEFTNWSEQDGGPGRVFLPPCSDCQKVCGFGPSISHSAVWLFDAHRLRRFSHLEGKF